MPTKISSILPKPNNWKEFEQICVDILEFYFSDYEVSRYARSGQSQHGIDILAVRPQENREERIGIQCKNVENLTESKIRNEVKATDDFNLKLDEYRILTTHSADNDIQDSVRGISEEMLNNDKFPIYIWFWDKITRIAGRNKEIIKNHYPDFFDHDINSNKNNKSDDIGSNSHSELVTESPRNKKSLESEIDDLQLRKILKNRTQDIRQEYSNYEHHINTKVTLVSEDTLGILVKLYNEDHLRLLSTLEDIDQDLFNEGYNTAWIYEKRPLDSTELDEYLFTGATHATLLGEGIPNVPDVNSTYESSSHRNIHKI